MTALRVLWVSMFVGMALYTGLVVSEHGWTLFSVYARDIASLTWAGQFNIDFACYLMFSSLWIAWRHQFAPVGIAMSAIASVAGILFFAPYLLIISVQAKGNTQEILLGKARAHA